MARGCSRAATAARRPSPTTLQCDHVKGVRTGTDLAPQVLSLSTNVELLTAIANDLGYENVFAYQLQSQARPGDVLMAVSSSGRSPNIVRALTWARDHGLRTIAITGFDGGGAGPWPRSASTSTARTTASSRTCTRRSCTPWPSTSASHGWAPTRSPRRCSEPCQPCKPGGDADAAHLDIRRTEPAGTNARGNQSPDGGSSQSLGGTLVLDPGHPRDGQAAGIRRGTAPAGEPEVAAPPPGLRAERLLHHLPVVQRAAKPAHAE